MANTMSRYQPQPTLNRLPDMMDRLIRESFVLPGVFDRTYGNGGGRTALPVNLVETPDGYLLQAALPGLKVDGLDVHVVGREVTIKGAFEVAVPENSTWIWQGIPTSEFQESYTLPMDVNGDNTEATYEHGILTLSLPKAEHVKPKTIKVNVAK